MSAFRIGCVLGLAVCASSVVRAQSFNIDLDIGSGSPDIGAGGPSSAFGAAAGQPGFWNVVYAGGPYMPLSLFGLSGAASGATIQATGGFGSGGGDNFHGNTGDYALLLNDYAQLLGPDLEVDYHFAGMQPGHYLIY